MQVSAEQLAEAIADKSRIGNAYESEGRIIVPLFVSTEAGTILVYPELSELEVSEALEQMQFTEAYAE